MLSLPAIKRSIVEIIESIPLAHWVVIGFLTAAVIVVLLATKKAKTYAAVSMGIVVFVALLFLETAVIVRLFDLVPYILGVDFKVDVFRVFQSNKLGYETFFNIVLFVPFGFFLSEYLYVTRRPSLWRCAALSTIATLLLSLSVETLQFLLRVGFFEMTDLVTNTFGGLVGAALAALFRFIYICINKNRMNTHIL